MPVVKPENMDAMSDDSSVVFLSEYEVEEDPKEDEDEEDEASITVDVEDDKDAAGIILQERFVVTETTTRTQISESAKVDKYTQTRADEFPVRPTYADVLASRESNVKVMINNSSSDSRSVSKPDSGTRKTITYNEPSTTNNNSSTATSENKRSNGNNGTRKTITYDEPSTSTNNSSTTRSKNRRNNEGTSSRAYADHTTVSSENSYGNSKTNDSGSYVRNPINNNNSGSNIHKTWKQTKTYRNYRVQPYQRYNNYNNQYYKHRNNNNVWDRPPNNYYNRQDNYNRYNTRDYDNNYSTNRYQNNGNNYYNHYNNQPKQWGIRTYTYQFKERLFHGFVQFMDFVFQYDYSRN